MHADLRRAVAHHSESHEIGEKPYFMFRQKSFVAQCWFWVAGSAMAGHPRIGWRVQVFAE